MDSQEISQRLEILYLSKEELEGIIERAPESKAKMFESQLRSVNNEIKTLEQQQ